MAIKYINDIQIVGSIESNSADDTNKILLSSKSGDLSLQFINGKPCLVVDGKGFIIPLSSHTSGGTLATVDDVNSFSNFESFSIPSGLSVSSNKVTWTVTLTKTYTYTPDITIYSVSSGVKKEVLTDVSINGTKVTVTLNVSAAPAAGSYIMTVVGK